TSQIRIEDSVGLATDEISHKGKMVGSSGSCFTEETARHSTGHREKQLMNFVN
ncbi:hypothetical protein STEG23_033711, partial [Scotinomys teguina]